MIGDCNCRLRRSLNLAAVRTNKGELSYDEILKKNPRNHKGRNINLCFNILDCSVTTSIQAGDPSNLIHANTSNETFDAYSDSNLLKL